jgi:LemA protein
MTATLIVIAVAIALVALLVLGIYNGIIGGHNRAQRAWSDVLVYERQKIKVLDALQEQATGFKAHEKEILERITTLRSAITALPQNADGKALAAVEDGTKGLLGGLRVAFEAYPELKAGDVVNHLMREIVEQQENVSAAISIFNSEVERFNNSIQMFPGSIVNSSLNKKSVIRNFSDTDASKSFGYQPGF